MYSSNCCFLTCTQISQEAGQVVWYSLLFQNFPQFIVIHTVKGFGIVQCRWSSHSLLQLISARERGSSVVSWCCQAIFWGRGKLCLVWFPLCHWVEAQETMAPLLLALRVEWPRCWPCRQNGPGAWAWLWNRVWVTHRGFGAATYIGQPADATRGPVGGLH